MIQPPRKIESANSFYDTIAEDYNSYMTTSDGKTREAIKHIFKTYVSHGNVMDFGGGTGLDLPWLLKDGYEIFFIEPSAAMRSVAKKTVPPSVVKSPIFIEKHTSLDAWSPENLPFYEKMDGVLANFAVLNCIKNPADFFTKIALVCGAQCHVLVTVLDPRLQTIYKSYSIFSALRMLLSGRLKILNKHKEVYHETYIHSIHSLKSSSHKFFKLSFYERLESSSFVVLIFSRK